MSDSEDQRIVPSRRRRRNRRDDNSDQEEREEDRNNNNKKNKSSRENVNAYVKEVFDASVIPRERLSVHSHYNVDMEMARDLNASEMEFASYRQFHYWFLLIPMEYFNASSQGFSDMKFEQEPDMCQMYMAMYQLMLYVMYKVFSGLIDKTRVSLAYNLVLAAKKRSDDQETPEFVARLWRLRVPSFCNMGEIIEDLIEQNRSRLRRQEEIGVVHRPSFTTSSSSSPTTGGSKPSSYVTNKPILSYFKYLTIEQWKKMCNVIYNVASPNRENFPRGLWFPIHPDENVLSSHDSIYHPKNAGSLWNCLEKYRYPTRPTPDENSVHIRNYIYCRPNAPFDAPPLEPQLRLSDMMLDLDRPYEEEEKKQEEEEVEVWSEQDRLLSDYRNWTAYVFPHQGKYTWNISVDGYSPTNFRQKIFPEVVYSGPTNTEAKSRYVRLNGVRNASSYRTIWLKSPTTDRSWLQGLPLEFTLSLQCRNQGDNESRALEFDEEVNMIPLKHKGFGLDEMIDSYKAMVSQNAHRLSRCRIQCDGLYDFDTKLWHLDAIVPPSTKSVITFLDKFQKKHGNLSLPMHGLEYNNISSFGNFLISLNSSFERDGVDTYHMSLMTIWLCGCGVPMGDKLQLNICKCGPHSACKTHCILHAQKLWVHGTYQNETYASAKSTTGMGEDLNDPCRHLIHHEMILTQDEAPPTSLGITKGNVSDSSEEASITKYCISEGVMRNKVYVQGENGVRICKYTEIPCVAARFYGTNEDVEHVSGPIGSRFLMSMEANKNRMMNGGLISVMMKEQTDAQKVENGYIMERCQLIHARVFKLCQLIRTGIIKPVNMTMGYTWINAILKVAYKKGVTSAREPRCLLRVIKLVKILVMVEAVVLLFDHPDSMIKDRPWDEKYWKLIEQYLYVKQEHISLAFGMLEQQYESPVRMKVEYAVYCMVKRKDALYCDPKVQIGEKKRVLDEHKQKVGQYLGMTTPMLEDKIKRFIETHHMMSIPGLMKVTNHNKMSASINPMHDRVVMELLEKAVINSGLIKDHYREGVVTNILKSLVDISNITPVIKILSDGYIAIEKRVNDGRPTSVLKLSVQEGLQHRHSTQKDLLYGRPWSDEAPFLPDLISIKNGNGQKQYPVLYATPPGFMEKQLELACQAIASSDYEEFKRREEKNDPSYTISLSLQPLSLTENEKENKYARVTRCGDDISAELRAAEIGLTDIEKHYVKPSYLPSRQVKQHSLHCENKKVPYPQGFIQLYPDIGMVHDELIKEKTTYTTDDMLKDLKAKYKQQEEALRLGKAGPGIVAVVPLHSVIKETEEEERLKQQLEVYEKDHPIGYLFNEAEHPMMMIPRIEEQETERVVYIDDVKDQQGNITCPEYLKDAEQRYYEDLEMERHEQQLQDKQASTEQEQRRAWAEQQAIQQRDKIIFRIQEEEKEEKEEKEEERYIVRVDC